MCRVVVGCALGCGRPHRAFRSGNPLERPPLAVCQRGIKAIAQFFEENPTAKDSHEIHLSVAPENDEEEQREKERLEEERKRLEEERNEQEEDEEEEGESFVSPRISGPRQNRHRGASSALT